MKKFLLAMSIGCFGITIIMSWFCSIFTGIIMTLVLGALIGVDVYLIKNNPRLWVSITMFVLSIILLFWISTCVGRNSLKTETNDVYNELRTEEVSDEDETEIINEEEELEEVIDDEPNEIIEEQPSTVVKEVIREVPVEKVVVKEVVKEVPKVEYVEVEKEPETNTQTTPPSSTTPPSTTTNTNNTNNNVNYGGPTTVYGYGYGYQNGYGYPGYNSNSTSIKIKGATEVYAGDTESYTISGVNSISKSKLNLPENVSYVSHSGNKVKLYFDEDFTGGYCMIEYGSAKLKVDVIPD